MDHNSRLVLADGLNSKAIFAARDDIANAVPELSDDIAKLYELHGDRTCCGGRSKTGSEIAKHLVNFKAGGGDLSPLAPIIGDTVKAIDGAFTMQNAPAATSFGKSVYEPSCKACVCEHIGDAILYAQESDMGHPLKKHLAVSSLGLAAAEALADYPDFAADIRAVKLSYRDGGKVNLWELLERADSLPVTITKT